MRFSSIPIRNRRPFAKRRSFVELLERRELLATYTTPEDTPLIVNDAVLAGAVIVTQPAHGKLILADSGGFSFAPAHNYNGEDRFVYRVGTSTNTLASESQTISIAITPVNDAPEAHGDQFLVQQNTPLSIPAPGVLKNDTDVDSEHLKAQLVTGPKSGTVALNEDGSFVYTPATDFTGADSFTYLASDGTAQSAAATVSLYVTPNPKPEARNDAYSVPQNGTLNIGKPGVLANDSGINGRPLTASVEKAPEHGTLELNSDGSFSYKPATNYTGSDSFMYRATDVSPAANPLPAAYSVATVTINVRPITPIVFANSDVFFTLQNTPLAIGAPGVLKNDYVLIADPANSNTGTPNTSTTVTSPPSFPLSAAVVEEPGRGTLDLKSDGSFTYTPADGFTGAVTFTYRAGIATAAGAAGASATDPIVAPHDVATVTIYVQPTHIPVYAFDDEFRTLLETPLNVTAPGVLANDTTIAPPLPLTPNPAGDENTGSDAVSPGPNRVPLNAELLKPPSHGKLTFHSDGSFEYVPDAKFTGVDTFTYQALAGPADGTTPANATLASTYPCVIGGPCPTPPDDIGTVTIYVKAPEPPPGPAARDDFFVTAENTTLSIKEPGVLANDYVRLLTPTPAATDNSPVRIPLTAVLVVGPAHGTLKLNANGSFDYAPTAGYVGPDSFTYQASLAATTADGTPQLSNIATVNLHVVTAIAHGDEYSTPQDTPLTVTAPGVLANDAGGSQEHPLIATQLTGPYHGKLTLNGDGSFTYVPNAGYFGPDMFAYRAGDGTTAADPTTGTTAAGDNNQPVPSNAIDVGIVRLNVRRTLAAVEAHNDKFTTPTGTILTIAAPGVLANDSGPANVALAASLVDGPGHGTLTLDSNGGFVYTPAADFSGEDHFVYRASQSSAAASDANGFPGGSLAVVTIYVLPATTPPKFIPGQNQNTTDESGPQRIADFATVVAARPDGTPATFIVTTDNTRLFAAPPTIDPTGQLIYTPAPNVSGQATVTVILDDGDPTNGGDSQTFTIDVAKPHPLFNAAQPCDVTSDGTIAPGDALEVINYINAFGDKQPGAAEGEAGSSPYYDVSGDGAISPVDALMVIDYLNASQPQSQDANAEATDAALLSLAGQDLLDATTGKRRTN